MKISARVKLSHSLIVFALVSMTTANAQTKISGVVKDAKGSPIPFANIAIQNTIEGTTSDSTGKFRLKVSEKGKQVLVATCIGYKAYSDTINLNKNEIFVEIRLKDESYKMNEVVITAGSMEANNDREVAILKPLDIYTNAAAAGDIVGAITSLPGVQKVGDQTGLFVRGGDASESKVVIDGMVVQNPFGSDIPGVSQRSRFTPFQFKGIAFSSGGYSARYGQALSSVLELNTMDLADKSTVNLNVNMSGVSLSGDKRWKSSSGEITGYYSNLSPFFSLATTNFRFYDVPKGGGFSAKWVSKADDKGLFKAFIKYDNSSSGTDVPDPGNAGSIIPYGLKNNNTYFNTSYKVTFDKLTINTAGSFSDNNDNIQWGPIPAANKDWRAQWRGEAWYNFSDQFSLLLGSELQRFQYKSSYDTLHSKFDEFQAAGYLEAEWKPAPWFAIKPGLRFERSDLLNDNSLSPRIALAFKTGRYSQISLASGVFYQDPDKMYLLPGHRPKFEQADHYIANYQWIRNDRSFRMEGYYKSYNSLIRELNTTYDPNIYRFVYGPVDNSGNGYARGLDIFWRDKTTIKNFDYWISYSYIDTKRLYENYPAKATPNFVSNHNFNILLKYFIDPLQLNIDLSYTYLTGKPYYNPLSSQFMGDKSPEYQDMALTLSYLLTVGKFFSVAYLSVDNLTNRKNVLGYRYSNDGVPVAIQPALYRWIFAGFNISLTAFSKEEL